MFFPMNLPTSFSFLRSIIKREDEKGKKQTKKTFCSGCKETQVIENCSVLTQKLLFRMSKSDYDFSYKVHQGIQIPFFYLKKNSFLFLVFSSTTAYRCFSWRSSRHPHETYDRSRSFCHCSATLRWCGTTKISQQYSSTCIRTKTAEKEIDHNLHYLQSQRYWSTGKTARSFNKWNHSS